MNEAERRFEYQQEDPLAAARGIKNGFIAAAIIWGCIIGAALWCSGCANVKPVINADGKGGGVAVTTEQGGWVGPLVLTAGGVYALTEIIDALKDKNNTYNYSGTYTEYTAGNDNVVNSQNRENPKRMKSEAVKRRK